MERIGRRLCMKTFKNLTTAGKVIWSIIAILELVIAWGMVFLVVNVGDDRK